MLLEWYLDLLSLNMCEYQTLIDRLFRSNSVQPYWRKTTVDLEALICSTAAEHLYLWNTIDHWWNSRLRHRIDEFFCILATFFDNRRTKEWFIGYISIVIIFIANFSLNYSQINIQLYFYLNNSTLKILHALCGIFYYVSIGNLIIMFLFKIQKVNKLKVIFKTQ